MKKILVPTDFSTTAQSALDVAVAIAKKSEAEIILLHVLEEVEEGSFNVEGEAAAAASSEYHLFTLKLLQKVRQQLNRLVEQTSLSGVRIIGKLRLGNSFHGIRATITEQRVDMVVMGTKGASGLEEVFIGSNTEKVVRRSECPVLAVNQTPLSVDFKSIVYATSLIENEIPFSEVVKKMQNIFDCPIHLVHINTPGMFVSDRQIRHKMEEFVKAAKLKNCTFHFYSDFSEEEGIIHFADSVDAGMIAMMTHGRIGLAHLLNNSIAEGVVNHSRRPVLTSVISKKGKK